MSDTENQEQKCPTESVSSKPPSSKNKFKAAFSNIGKKIKKTAQKAGDKIDDVADIIKTRGAVLKNVYLILI